MGLVHEHGHGKHSPALTSEHEIRARSSKAGRSEASVISPYIVACFIGNSWIETACLTMSIDWMTLRYRDLSEDLIADEYLRKQKIGESSRTIEDGPMPDVPSLRYRTKHIETATAGIPINVSTYWRTRRFLTFQIMKAALPITPIMISSTNPARLCPS